MTSPDSDLPPQTSPVVDDRPHKPADDREEIYFQGTPMIRGELGRLFTCTIIGLLFIAAPFVYRFLQKDHLMPVWWGTLACIVVGVLIMTIPWFLTKFVHYRISNYRIDFEHGLLSKDIDTLELWHVEDIHFHQSLLDRMLGVGTITVISHDDTTPRLLLKSLPKARPLFDTLKQRVIAVKRQRGVIKMDVGN
jgi:membrane protein YdbS with pleckstrin-like domain